eukprot:scaffold70358_cov69-Cyclotella_meneghiniana.AAC.8
MHEGNHVTRVNISSLPSWKHLPPDLDTILWGLRRLLRSRVHWQVLGQVVRLTIPGVALCIRLPLPEERRYSEATDSTLAGTPVQKADRTCWSPSSRGVRVRTPYPEGAKSVGTVTRHRGVEAGKRPQEPKDPSDIRTTCRPT